MLLYKIVVTITVFSSDDAKESFRLSRPASGSRGMIASTLRWLPPFLCHQAATRTQVRVRTDEQREPSTCRHALPLPWTPMSPDLQQHVVRNAPTLNAELSRASGYAAFGEKDVKLCSLRWGRQPLSSGWHSTMSCRFLRTALALTVVVAAVVIVISPFVDLPPTVHVQNTKSHIALDVVQGSFLMVIQRVSLSFLVFEPATTSGPDKLDLLVIHRC